MNPQKDIWVQKGEMC